MNHRMLRLLALFAALALVLAACGDDDDDATDDATATDDDGSAAEDDGDGGGSLEDSAEDAAEDAIGSELGGDCAFLAEFAGTGFGEALDEVDPFTDAGAGFQALAEEFGEVAGAAPDEIADAFETMAEGITALADALEDVDFSDPESVDPTAFETFDDPKFQEASDEVEAWIAEHCPAAG